ncbi:MAG: hypothetical protein LBJ11_08080 [Oscillospiraceae bacterium]|jgi:hypothetical protein|nr:hypothetical protein [Oscillospiraceae bacterium]
MQLKPLIRDTRAKIYRATGIVFLVQLFGALGAGFFFVVQNILGVHHMLGALEPVNEKILWFILFWGTDFYVIAMSAVLCYLIAGLPGLAPGLALSVYFAHFSAGTSVIGEEGYFAFFATPIANGGGVNLGYLGYFLMALICALLIKLLYAGWDAAKLALGKKLDKTLDKLRKKVKLLPAELTGLQVIENVDLIVLVLIIPVASAAATFVLIRYGLQKPFDAFVGAAEEPLQRLLSSHIVLAGLLFGLMVGFDITGPVSMTAFSAASAAFLLNHDAQPLTIYGVCFIAVGWAPLFAALLGKVLKKKVPADQDEFNLAVSGPINAFFENIKLTVAFSMPYALRAPFAVIPGLMAGAACAGGVTALAGIVNDSYLTTPPKYGLGKSMAELLERGEIYLSFTLPLRSGDWLRCRIPLFFIILLGGAVGGAVIYALRLIQVKGQKRRGTYVESAGDIVLDMRKLGQKRRGEMAGK